MCDKNFITNTTNISQIINNQIKFIIICTEFIYSDIKNNGSLMHLNNLGIVSIKEMFNTNLLNELIGKNKLIKNSNEYKIFRNELRFETLTKTNIIKEISEYDENILLVCNNCNKMSPSLAKLINEIRYNESIDIKPNNKTSKEGLDEFYKKLKSII